MGDELVAVLKEISTELKGIRLRLDESETAVRDLRCVVVDWSDKTSTLHKDLITEANKLGTQINQHQRVIQSQEARIARLERSGANGAA